MYLSGFGHHHETEALEGALPKTQNSPQICPYNLYAEQLSGSAFTRPRHQNLHSWLYRILSSVAFQEYKPYLSLNIPTFSNEQPPMPMRWSPLMESDESIDFLQGLFPIAGNDLVFAYLYQCNQSMTKRYFWNADGELLFVPYQGAINLHTEFGVLSISPGKIAVIPRGIKFRVELQGASAAGYLCENTQNPLHLPALGPIGANGLANPRHFLYPQAAFENTDKTVEIIAKYLNKWWITQAPHSPLNVVAWQGNYAPYLYDLSLFNTINTVSFDHPDPSIFTVLTSESEIQGVANLDFVIFPPRWMVAEHTFRPPYFHRNIMNELMGLILGKYDAKAEGFYPGGYSIHNCMTAHGPDVTSFKAASNKTLKPEYYHATLAFMFETRKPWLVTQNAFNHATKQTNYLACWENFKPASI